MTLEDLIPAVAAWVAETVPELTTVYELATASKPEGLPDAVLTPLGSSVVLVNDVRFAMWDLQQRQVYAAELEVSFMVDNSDQGAAQEALTSMEGRLLLSALQDPTLGGRVPFCSPAISFDLRSPLVEYEDGTLGREMTMTLAVGDLVEA